MVEVFGKTLVATRWDGMDTHVEYYSENEDSEHFKNPIGEMDIVFYDWDEPALKYVEVKTNRKHIEDGEEQLERAKNFFDETEFEFYGDLYVEDIERTIGVEASKKKKIPQF